MRNDLLKECALIHENAEYTAEAHHQVEARERLVGRVLSIGPAVITAILGALTGTGWIKPEAGALLTAASAVFTALATGLDPLASADAHLRAAKAWTNMKHDARRLRDTFSSGMTDDALTASVHALADRYKDLVDQSPVTTDSAFEKAREKIQNGRHKPDNPALQSRV
jgi:hypothetical protein